MQFFMDPFGLRHLCRLEALPQANQGFETALRASSARTDLGKRRSPLNRTHYLKRCLFLLVLSNTDAFSAAYQIFHTLAYDNPAALNSVNRARVILGGTDLFIKVRYTGLVDDTYSSVLSDTNTIFPYFRAAKRFNPKWVGAFEVTHPALTNIRYPSPTFISNQSVDTIVKDNNYSPKFSYQLTDKLAIGIGFDANHVTNAQVNYIHLDEGKIINLSSGWGYGWDAGLVWQLSPAHTFNFSYYSKIIFGRLKGTSQLGNRIYPNFTDNMILPNTYQFSLAHTLIPRWVLSEMVRYIQWDAEQNLTLRNTATGSHYIPLNYNNTWNGIVSLSHTFSEQWSGYLAAEYDQSPQSVKYRTIGLPAAALTIFGTGVNYQWSKQWCTKLQYAYVYTSPAIKQTYPVVQNGRISTNVNIVDLGVTWQI